jgi:hypothetical protein
LLTTWAVTCACVYMSGIAIKADACCYLCDVGYWRKIQWKYPRFSELSVINKEFVLEWKPKFENIIILLNGKCVNSEYQH